jgi:O-antigen/teichoic acid export membrane protein
LFLGGIDMHRYLLAFKNYLFLRGHSRSVRAIKNIYVSFLVRGLGVGCSFLLVPLSLRYLDPARYGIWLTLSSLIGWVGYLNLGLGLGLRNKFAEAVAQKKTDLARIYVSTTYAVLIIIIFSLYIVFMGINPFLNWSKLLNADPSIARELSILAIIVFTMFAFNFVLKLIGTIATADQHSAIEDSFDIVTKIVSIIIIYILTKTTSGSLLYLGATYSLVPVLVLAIASIILYKNKYAPFKPSIKHVKFKYIKQLTSLSIQFFIITITFVIIFLTDNMIITRLYGPAAVTPYNIAYKYFSIITMIFVTLSNPFWSASTDAYAKKDIVWIKNTLKGLLYIWVILVCAVFAMLLLSKWFYKVWVGNAVEIPFSLSAGMALFAIISTWNNLYITFINGIGKIRLQLISSIIIGVLNIPLAIILAKYLNFGTTGVILANCICLLLGGSVLNPIQFYKIINGKDKGIWAK